jgi:hypothetical protein
MKPSAQHVIKQHASTRVMVCSAAAVHAAMMKCDRITPNRHKIGGMGERGDTLECLGA